ncbi:YciI family protein [Herbiconiux sp. P15]|uniref:YciI family protein n=1 Tax=Herbiconiux liukaitaii TaxID=3342799 RepID=UPI0035B7292F
MKYMLIMRSTEDAKTAYEDADFEQIINAMGAYNEAMMKAGVLLAGDGLADDMSKNFVVDFSAETPIVTDGPYGETHELFSGFWMLEVSSKEEAVEWATRAPLGAGSKLEVRRVTEMSDFEGFEDNEFLKKEEGWREEQANR